MDAPAVASALRQAGLAADKVKKAIEKLRAGKKVDSAKAEQNYEVRAFGCMCGVWGVSMKAKTKQANPTHQLTPLRQHNTKSNENRR